MTVQSHRILINVAIIRTPQLSHRFSFIGLCVRAIIENFPIASR